MAEVSNLKDAVEAWKEWCENVQHATTVDKAEKPSSKKARIKKLRDNYADFVNYYFPHYVDDPDTGEHTECAPFHIKTANRIKKARNLKEVAMWARGHAKSTHFDIFIPMWLKCQEARTFNVMVLVSKSEDNAKILLGDIQAELQCNQRYINDFGKQHNKGSWEDGKFITSDGCAFFARGRGQSPRGLRYRSKRPDYIVIDDLDDDKFCENEDLVTKATKWVKEALFGTLNVGRGRFIMVGNLISKNSVLANIATSDGVTCTKVNALDSRGRVSWAAKWTLEEVKDMESFMGYSSFQKEMFNNPITEGAIFKNNWIRWKSLPPLNKYDVLVAYCDPSFKATKKSDYKAIKMWGKIGTELHQRRAFVRQCSIAEMVRWWYDLHESLPSDVVCYYFMEANFLQDTILDEFTREGELRGYQLPISGDTGAKANKGQRIEAISPLWERGFVFYDIEMENDPDTKVGLEQTLAFEKGSSAHDDSPDADEGAVSFLQKQTRIKNFAPIIGRRATPKNSW